MLRNFLMLNSDKSKLKVFGTRKMLLKLQDITLSLLGKDLLPCENAKDLGVLLDPHLSYNNHIIKTVSSGMSSLGQINRVKHAFGGRTPLVVINTLVFSKLFLLFKRVGQLLKVKYRQTSIGTKLCV